MNGALGHIFDEVKAATEREVRAYLLGALHDGTFNRTHRTVRIAQAEPRWLDVLQLLFSKLGSRSWIYREGARSVWVIETTCRLAPPPRHTFDRERAAYARGYFDAEGGVPNDRSDRFYVQFVQKDYPDLNQVRETLTHVGIKCGVIHNPSARVDPGYWRFYVLAASHHDFIRRVGSWHPRKRRLLEPRLTWRQQ